LFYWLEKKGKLMSVIKNLLDTILNCDNCYGQGVNYWANGEDYDFEYCDCNPYRLILENGEIVDNGDLTNV
jgi:hypothetical protein